MAIKVNGEDHPWHEALTVERLMEEKKYSFPLKIVTINGLHIPRDEYATTAIADGDEVGVIHMMSGG